MMLQMTDRGLLVRAPLLATEAQINRFVRQNSAWIEKQQRAREQRRAEVAELGVLTPADIEMLAEKAREYIPGRVEYYAGIVGVKYGRVTIRNQKTRWGSCSSKGNLNFNCLLMLTPPEVIDSVVVHELCHLKEMNHSQRFYDEVYRVFPQYDKWHRWLRKNGKMLMERMKAGEENE